MLADRYGLALSTSSPAARDAYVEGYDLMFGLWPGAAERFARATAEDPGFALAHLGSAQVAAAMGDVPGAIEPELTFSSFFARIPFPLERMAETYAEALKAAGLPE